MKFCLVEGRFLVGRCRYSVGVLIIGSGNGSSISWSERFDWTWLFWTKKLVLFFLRDSGDDDAAMFSCVGV